MSSNDAFSPSDYSDFDMNFFSVIDQISRQSRQTNIFSPVPLVNSINVNGSVTSAAVTSAAVTSTPIENLLLTPQLSAQIDTIYSLLIDNPSSAGMNTALNDSLYDVPSYKQVISEEGKKCLKYLNYSSDMAVNTCPILHTPFAEGDELIMLPCEHYFDSQSILTWLNNEKAECPVCRYQLRSIEKKYSTIS
uniref:RING-type domain-containing protein n=1 Tax=viral metagenome TaxID=1070528 RepID=A0A6C0C0C4_9ZZZZ